MVMQRILILGVLFLASSCAYMSTRFAGSAKVDGPAACQAKCREWGMELTSMVAMGDYTNGCVCRLPGKQSAKVDMDGGLALAAASTAGVIMQKQQDDEDEKRRQTTPTGLSNAPGSH